MPKTKIETSNVWDNKYLREAPTMPFGSMCNAYGQVNHGKGTTLEQFKTEMTELFALANELIKAQYLSTQPKVEKKGSIDIPT